MRGSRDAGYLANPGQQGARIVTLAKRMPGPSGFEFVCKTTNLLKIAAELLKIRSNDGFNIDGGPALGLNTRL